MEEALRLAGTVRKSVLPNPRVGSLVVKKGKIIGRGTHKGPGRPHAEIVALRRAGRRARGATLYVTLEPCRHTGRTPPCTEAILAAEVKRVFYAVRDPNPLVKGKGARALRRAGIEVELVGGPVAREARKLNTAYFHFHKTGRPHITAKVATTLDGKIATAEGYSKWITDKNARAFARRLRGEHQAVLVGIETVLADNPRLTLTGTSGRGTSKRNEAGPLQIILDSKLRIPLESRLVKNAKKSGKLIVATARGGTRRKAEVLRAKGVEVWQFSAEKRVPLKPLLAKAAEREIASIFVEGGAKVLGSFFDAKLVDKVYWFVAPTILGSARAMSAVDGRGARRLSDALRLRVVDVSLHGKSWLLEGYPKK